MASSNVELAYSSSRNCVQQEAIVAARPVHREPYCEVMRCAKLVHTGTAERAVQYDVSTSCLSSDDFDQEAVAAVVAAAAVRW
eukprot:17561-Heterococcus_DN1.PRE.1